MRSLLNALGRRVKRDIDIGADWWLGANAVVLDGCRVGDGAIVAAGAVLTDNLAPRAVAAGVPARIVKSRGADSL